METLGYSERGVINSLLYEIQYKGGEKLLLEFISKIIFPFHKTNPIEGIIKSADKTDEPDNQSELATMIEQSFSDFGDSDIVFLLKYEKKKDNHFHRSKSKNLY